MKTISAFLLLFVALLAAVDAQTGEPWQPLTNSEWRAALRAIVESERGFCRAAAEKGTKEAFLAFMSEDAILFRPQPVPGKKWMTERPAPSGMLSWRPIFADVSAAGDLGYTTGPYEFQKQPSDPVPASYGNYVTIWKRQSDGGWKVLIDDGAANPAPAKPLPDFDPLQARISLPGQRPGGKGALVDLAGVDLGLSELCARQGPRAALGPRLAGDIRFFRAGRRPAVGKEEVLPLLPSEPGIWAWQPVKSEISRSGDLGYTYGTFQVRSGKSDAQVSPAGHYLRIWRSRQPADWQLVLDITVL